MHVKNSQTIQVLLSFIQLTNSLDDSKTPVRRTSIPKEHFRGWKSAKKALLSCYDIGLLSLGDDKNDIANAEWIPWTETLPEGKRIAFEKVVRELDLTHDQIAAIKYCYNTDKPEIPDVSDEAFEEIEAILK